MAQQQELFYSPPCETAQQCVPGFRLQKDYLCEVEEGELLRCIDQELWDTDWRRRVQRYGSGYGPSTKISSSVFPQWLVPLASRIQQSCGFERFPENCVINEYLPGQGIAPHKDYLNFGPKVACVSLGSDVVLDFHSENRTQKHSVVVPRRSLWIIEGEARYKWLHGIAPRLHDYIAGTRVKRERRISITFRLKASVKGTTAT